MTNPGIVILKGRRFTGDEWQLIAAFRSDPVERLSELPAIYLAHNEDRLRTEYPAGLTTHWMPAVGSLADMLTELPACSGS